MHRILPIKKPFAKGGAGRLVSPHLLRHRSCYQTLFVIHQSPRGEGNYEFQIRDTEGY
jgi:hypothetical protein